MRENTPEEVSFGEWLKRQRNARGLTRQQLAQQVNCAVITLRKIESEERRPSAQIVERLAEIFSVPQAERKAFLRFARGDGRSAPSETGEDFPWHTRTPSLRLNLPARITSLVGRQNEIADILRYLQQADTRLITLIGPPGIGKTRLSLEVIRTPSPGFPDGVFFIALSPLEDPRLIAPTIVQALGYIKANDRSDDQLLVQRIGERRILIVLDNCEHLVDAVASLASELLSGCPRLKILATSREALRIPGEWLYRVPPLDVPPEDTALDTEVALQFPALRLFTDRARAVHSSFALDSENIRAVASVCARLDGLPLGIELAAARIRRMSPQALLANLNEQLVLPADRIRNLPARQQSVDNAIDWSYRLLASEEQRMLAWLSVFSGGFTLQAAESIFSRAATRRSIMDLIASLLDKSMLQPARNEQGELRLNMLMTIRQFALSRLREMGEETQIREWHLAYFLEFAEQADKRIHGPHQIEWMDRLETEHDNCRAAFDWSLSSRQTEQALRLFGALGWFRRLRGYLAEARAGFERVRAQLEVLSYPAAYARVLNAMGRVTWLQGEYSLARLLLDESREIWQKLGPAGEQGLAEALDFLGLVARSSGRGGVTPQDYFEQSIALYRKCGDRWGLAEGLFHSGITALTQRESDLALALFEQSLALFTEVGDLWAIGRVSSQLANLFMGLGEFEKAQSILEQGLDNDRRLQFKQGVVNDLLIFADLKRYRGDYDQAVAFAQEGLALGREYGLEPDVCDALYSLGLVALHRNDYSAASRYFTDFLNLAMKTQGGPSIRRPIIGLAAVAAGTSQYERAAKLYGVAEALLETADSWAPPLDQAEFNRHLQIARGQLNEPSFEAFAAEGRAMAIEEAIEFARGASSNL